MSATIVFLPPVIRQRIGYQTPLDVDGETVRAIIEDLEHRFPGIRFNLCTDTGDLRPYVNVFIEKKNIRYLRGLDTLVPAGAHISILPSVAGG